MSEKHTQGRLAVGGAEDDQKRLVIDAAGKWYNNLFLTNGTFDYEDARRLAACWNAFDGVRTEMVEATVGTGAMQAACESMSELPAAAPNWPPPAHC